MIKQHMAASRFTKGQTVGISLYDEEGRLRNDLAEKCLAYSGLTGTIGSWGYYFLNGGTRLVYHVRMDNGKVLLLTEDCLMSAKSSN